MTAEVIDLDPVKTKASKVVAGLTEQQRQSLIANTRPRIVEPYFVHIPHPAQQVFLLMNNVREVMYGGSAGGGKSDALLMGALQYVDVPGYSALILRRTWPDLNAPNSILDRMKQWMAGLDVRKVDEGRQWIFPSGARIQFGYAQRKDEVVNKFQSAEYQYVGFDELTQFSEDIYTYMFSRVRRPSVSCLNCSTNVQRYRSKSMVFWAHKNNSKNCHKLVPDPKVLAQYAPSRKNGMTVFDVPLRNRSATNPGGYGHQWVKARFITEATRKKGAIFVPARLSDNPSLDQESYKDSLSHLLPVDRERLLNGDWDVEEEGNFFARTWFRPITEAPVDVQRRVRFWDLAASEADAADFTAGALVALTHAGTWVIEDIKRFKGSPGKVEALIKQTAMTDGVGVGIRMEQEPGSSGVNVIDNYRRNVLSGFDFKGIRSTGNKAERAAVVSSAAEAGNVAMLMGEWNVPFLDEATLFPGGAHDDQVDSVAGAINDISFASRTRILA